MSRTALALISLAVIVTGGVLISQETDSAKAATKIVFTDDFSDTQTLNNNWSGPGSDKWTLSGGRITGGRNNSDGYYTAPIFANNVQVLDGEIRATIERDSSVGLTAPLLFAREQANGDAYVFQIFRNSGSAIIAIFHKAASSDATRISADVSCPNYASLSSTDKAIAAFSLETPTAGTTNLTGTIYSGDGLTTLCTVSYTDSSVTRQAAGKWGVSGVYLFGGPEVNFDNVQITDYNYVPPAIDLNIAALTPNIKIGESTVIRVTDDEDQTLTLSDGGAGGTFSTNNVVLDSGNSYTVDVTYTPSKVGTVNVSLDGTSLSTKVFVSPFSTKIGYIGDSITWGVGAVVSNAVQNSVKNLGDGYTFLNHGISGATTTTFVGNNAQAGSFQSAGVEVVMIDLGTNDSLRYAASNPANDYCNGYGTPQQQAEFCLSAAEYKSNLQTIIANLTAAGVKRIILNDPIVGRDNARDPDLIEAYKLVLNELVDGEAVFRGDDLAYGFFSPSNTSYYHDGIHPNDLGYTELGGFWSDAYTRVIIDPLSTKHSFTGTTGNSYKIGSNTGVQYTVDKSILWFNPGVGNFANILIDNVIVPTSNYTAQDGSTVIDLASAFLDTLTTGVHNLTIRFSDGVSFNRNFNVFAATVNPTIPSGPSGATSPNVPSTGLFGLGHKIDTLLLGLLTILVSLGVILVGRKIQKDSE